jgi:hypothetical protein
MSTEQATANPPIAAGNANEPRNPFTRKVCTLRHLIVDCVAPEDIQRVVKGLVDRAAEGHVPAAKLFLNYAIGTPQPAPEPDRVDANEWSVCKETAPMAAESAGVIKAGTPLSHLQLVRMLQPIVTQMMRDSMLDVINETPEQRAAREAADAAEMERFLNSPAPEWANEMFPDENEEKKPSRNGFNGETAPSPNGFNGFNGETTPSPNGFNGEAASRNGYHRSPPSKNGDRGTCPQG